MFGDPAGEGDDIWVSETGSNVIPRETGEVASTTAARSERAATSRLIVVAVLGAALVCGAIAAYFSMRHPPYQTDESSQVGYMLEVRNGRLPSLDTPVPASEGGPLLEVAVGRPWPFSLPDIHTAINPPYPYAAAIVPATVTEAVDLRGGPLLGFRLFNAACTGLAVIVVHRLARELTGRDDAAVLAAVFFGTLLAVAQLGALAYLEGPAVLATTGAAWWLARFVRTRTLHDATVLGLWCAAAAGVRTMATAYAVSIAAVALVIGLVGARRHRFWPLVVRLGLPGIVAVGWFYALNWYRYGEPTGSQDVYGGREAAGSFLEVLFSTDSIAAPLDYLLLEVSGQRGWWEVSATRQWLMLAAVLAVLAAAYALVTRRRRRLDTTEEIPAGASPSSWVALFGVSVVPVLLMTYHVSNGGAGHPRYLTPLLPVIGCALALLVVQAGRWATTGVALAATVAFAVRIDAAGAIHEQVIFPKLAGPLAGQRAQQGALVLAAIGAVAMLGAVLALALRPGEDHEQPDHRARPTGQP